MTLKYMGTIATRQCHDSDLTAARIGCATSGDSTLVRRAQRKGKCTVTAALAAYLFTPHHSSTRTCKRTVSNGRRACESKSNLVVS